MANEQQYQQTVDGQLLRIEDAKDLIHDKLVYNWEVATSGDPIDVLAQKINAIDRVDRAATTINIVVDADTGELSGVIARNDQEVGFLTEYDAENNYAEIPLSFKIEGKTAFLMSGEDSYAEKSVADGEYSAGVNMTKGAGSVSVTGSVTLKEVQDKPASGFYITAQGSGSVSATGIAYIDKSGYIEMAAFGKEESGSETSNVATKYYTIDSANVPGTINPVTEESITITAGYTQGATIEVSDALLNRLKAI